jgi:hypothetical protein
VPEQIAFGPTGNLFVSDRTNSRVEEFSESGEFIRQFGEEGSGPGDLRTPMASRSTQRATSGSATGSTSGSTSSTKPAHTSASSAKKAPDPAS